MEIKISSLNDLEHAAKQFIADNARLTIFAFYGEMGAGKTTFIKAVCKNIGVRDMINSPSFSIVNEYLTDNGARILHLDLYRVKNMEELYDLGCEEIFYGSSICFIEWPELAESILPPETVKVTIKETADGTRIISY